MHSLGKQHSWGMIEPPRRGPWIVAIDLYRSGGSFRGFMEFAVIGAFVLAFLQGIPFDNPFAHNAEGRWYGSSTKTAPLPAGDDAKQPSLRKSVAGDSPGRPPVPSDLEPSETHFEKGDEPLRGMLPAAMNPRGDDQTGAFHAALSASAAAQLLLPT